MEKTEKMMEEYCCCKAHPDCFAYKNGCCLALQNTDFGHKMPGSGCRFYKPEWEQKAARKAVLKKLIERNRVDLLEKYMKDFEQWELDYIEDLFTLGDLEDLIDNIVAAEKEDAAKQENKEVFNKELLDDSEDFED